MRTNIEIDDDLMRQAMKSSGASTKKATVEQALELLIKLRAQAGIRKLRGKVDFQEDVLTDRNAHSVHEPPKRRKVASIA